MSIDPSPGTSSSAPEDPRRATQRLRNAMHRLAIGAGLGMPRHDLAMSLQDIWRDTLGSAEQETGSLSHRQRLAAELVTGTCATARWLDPARSAQAVAPLCVVLWHVGPLHGEAHAATLWLDMVVPADDRKAAAMEWAFDVRLLLAESDIPHCADIVLLDDGVSTAGDAASTAPAVIDVWGCMSLYHRYERSGVRSAQRAAFEPKLRAGDAKAPVRRRMYTDCANTDTAGNRQIA
jgi:hypothetical protein